MELLVINESFSGEYECRGENYSDTLVLDKEKLNIAAKRAVEKLLPEWIKQHGDVEPVNNVDWSWEDLWEDFCTDPSYQLYEYTRNEGEQYIEEVDLVGSKDRDLVNVFEYLREGNSGFEMQFEEFLNKYLTQEEIDDATVNINFQSTITATVNGTARTFIA